MILYCPKVKEVKPKEHRLSLSITLWVLTYLLSTDAKTSQSTHYE